MKKSQVAVELERLASLCQSPPVTLGQLVSGMSPKAMSVVTLLFSVVFLFPIPTFGLSTLLGSVVIFAGFRMALGLGPWVPSRMQAREIPTQTLEKMFGAASRFMDKYHHLIKPRMTWLSQNATARKINGALIAFNGILLAIPGPPGTNPPPAFGILLLSLGLSEDDGVVLILGYLVSLLNLLAILLIVFLGAEAWKLLDPYLSKLT
jgi:hypothetical protein